MKSILKKLSTALLPLVFALWAGLVAAQQMEIIELRHKTLDQVLPALLPLVEPGGTLTGMNNQLFLRASPRNRSDIKRVLAAIDTPTRRLISGSATIARAKASRAAPKPMGRSFWAARGAAMSMPASGTRAACVMKSPGKWCKPSKAARPLFRSGSRWPFRCARWWLGRVGRW